MVKRKNARCGEYLQVLRRGRKGKTVETVAKKLGLAIDYVEDSLVIMKNLDMVHSIEGKWFAGAKTHG